MSPPTNGRFSSSSSTGTVPKSGRMSGNRRAQDPDSGNPENLERVLRENQQKLRNLMENSAQNQVNSEEVLREKLQFLQNFETLRVDLQNQLNFIEQRKRLQDPLQELKEENLKLRQEMQNQQNQIHQLTQSLNQCFQVLLTIQRDVSNLQSEAKNTNSAASLEDNLGKSFDLKVTILSRSFSVISLSFLGHLPNFLIFEKIIMSLIFQIL